MTKELCPVCRKKFLKLLKKLKCKIDPYDTYDQKKYVEGWNSACIWLAEEIK